jgi:hypothetical protein
VSSEAEIPSGVFTPHDDPKPPRPPISWWAVAALILGLASVAAVFHPVLWAVAGLGLMVGSLALMRLQRAEKERSGYGLAVVGLVLAIVFVTAAPTRYHLRRWRVRQQATEVGRQWLKFLIDGPQYKAYGAMQPPETRGQLDSNYEARLFNSPTNLRAYERFQASRFATTLGALKGQSRLRYHATEEQIHDGAADRITNVYAVTFLDDDGNKKTFFVRLHLKRTDNPVVTTGFWQITSYRGGVRPRT